MTAIQFNNVQGSGGGGGKGGATDSPVESSNTLRSNERARVLELISEGPCFGFSDPEHPGNCIYFDQTPLINADGTVNFKGVQYSFRTGEPDQPDFAGNPQVETGVSVETEVKLELGPIVRTIAEQNATQVRVVVRIPSLALQDDKGSTGPNSVSYAVEVAPNNGAWVTSELVEITNQKCTSPFERATLVDLPLGGYPWQVRVRRITADSTDLKNQNSTIFTTYSIIVGGRFTYPNTALVFLNVNASLFGSTSIPQRRFRWKGLIISVPSNYDPDQRTYNGMWDGTFKQAWTNNPVWIFYDLLINDRYGMGEFIDASKVDKWSLYTISQYCDGDVPDGFGGMEPRYTFNGVINTREEAFKVLQNIASTWRGMTYWSIGQVFATADMPGDPVKLVSPANVLGGLIEYAGTALKARHSVAMVQWNDPQDFYRPNTELVMNDEMVAKFGWREVRIQLTGCTTRGMAHRYGKWALDTEQHQSESAEYDAAFDHLDVRPGDILAIADPRKAQVRLGGRIEAVLDPGYYTLDAAFEAGSGESYRLLVEGTDGEVHSAAVAGFYGKLVVVSPDFTVRPAVNAMWVITGTDIVPRQYRALALRENKTNQIHVSTLFHDPTKYARVEFGLDLDPLPYSRVKTTVRTVTNMHAVESLSTKNGVPNNRITLSWSYYVGEVNAGYYVEADTPTGLKALGTTGGTVIDLDDAALGDYEFRVFTLGATAGLRSAPGVLKFTAKGWEGLGEPYVTHLEIFGRGLAKDFVNPDCRIIWRNNFPGTTVQAGAETTGAGQGTLNPFYRDNLVRIYDTSTSQLLRTESVTTETYTYTFEHNNDDALLLGLPNAQRDLTFEVSIRDNLGRESKPATLAVTNPAPALVIPVVEGGLDTLFVTYLQPADTDWAGSLCWVQRTRDFDPLTTEPTYDGPNTALSLKVEPFHTYWIRVAGYDTFGKTDLNISPPLEASVGGVVINTDAPDVPTGLALSSTTETLGDGTVSTILVATWDAIPNELLSYYDIEIKQGTGNYVGFQASTNAYNFRGIQAGVSYTVHVRSVSKNGYPSAFCTAVSTDGVKKTTPPGAITNFAAVASLKAAYLSWTPPTDNDIAEIEIFRDTSTNKVGSSKGGAFTVAGLTTGTTYQFWVRAKNTSDVEGALTGPISVTPGQVANGDVAANAITADKITAGAITTEHFNVNGALPSSITVGSSGVSIGAIQASASNPAAAINANFTQIDPGKITISGGTTLASWRSGSDQTKIEGGNIYANSINANSLKVGSRGLAVAGIDFNPNVASNTLSWSSGSIAYTSDSGSPTVENIGPSSCLSYGIPTYIYWTKGTGNLFSTTDWSVVGGANNVVIACYQGGASYQLMYGGTIIDGTRIVTGSIQAAQIKAGTITGDQIGARTITAGHLAVGTITADLLVATDVIITNTLQLGNDLVGTGNVKTGAISAGNYGYGYTRADCYLDVPAGAEVLLFCAQETYISIGAAGYSQYSIQGQINGASVGDSAAWPVFYWSVKSGAGNDYGQQSRVYRWRNTYGYNLTSAQISCLLTNGCPSYCSIAALVVKR